jgi:hypothetical protein
MIDRQRCRYCGNISLTLAIYTRGMRTRRDLPNRITVCRDPRCSEKARADGYIFRPELTPS